jgi:hypothetical protein
LKAPRRANYRASIAVIFGVDKTDTKGCGQTDRSSSGWIGSFRMRLPVAAKIAWRQPLRSRRQWNSIFGDDSPADKKGGLLQEQ